MATTAMWKCQTIVTGVAGTPWYLTAYFDADAGTAQDASDAWFNFCFPNAAGKHTSLTYTTESTVDRVSPTSGDILGQEAVTPDSGTGLSTSPLLPTSNQGLVNLNTGLFAQGRQVRGKTFYPGPTEADSTTTGQPEPTYLGGLNTIGNALAGAPQCTWVVWAKSTGNWYPVVNVTASSKFAVLRSRRD